MAENAYEAMFILDSNRYARNTGGVAQQINDMISKIGGEILVSRLWEERRLAYPINGQRKGTYWIAYFKAPSEKIATLNREIHLDENILRSLVLKIDPRIVETLVSHAKAGPTEVQRAPAPVVRRPAPAIAEAVPEELGN
ncbi:MAG: 30S ribosomal protein S6 [Planctomycetes bacterium]|nr:30S ribosomal protein S6 [Planctomycetota bacterium]